MSIEVEPTSVCSECGSDLHTCTNCRSFDSSAPSECREPGVNRVAAKAGANRCESFAAKVVKGFDDSGTQDDAKAAFDELFDF